MVCEVLGGVCAGGAGGRVLVLRLMLGLLARSSRSSCVRSWCRLWCSCSSRGFASSEFTRSCMVLVLGLFLSFSSLNLVLSCSAK